MANVTKDEVPAETAEDFVEFLLTGVQVKGEFHCSECGYGVTVSRELPTCPMCGNDSWEQTSWSPFARARLQ
jgi:rubrerythrin